MIRKYCDKCGVFIPDDCPEGQWKGPEVYVEIYEKEEFINSKRVHLCNGCTKKLIDWLAEE